MSALAGEPPANRILAIDGPAGAGKSTVAARMASDFGLLNIETGAMYRAFGLRALQAGVSPDDAAALEALSTRTRVELIASPAGSRVLLDGEDVSGEVRQPAVSDAASRVSVHAAIRAWMVGLQQAVGRSAPGGIVMEGRDIGTVVFPEASLKIFLFASPEARTERRLIQTGQTDAARLLAAMRARDERDRGRAESPLRPAADAVQLDSTALSLDEVISRVSSLVQSHWGLRPASGAASR